ncbi:alkaline phosphatase [Flavihumibacter solisilvae]|uniref:alkaline phosphatase n=1 Tax=Flavihumibacter solisilvae TaxID=1349421 RepID=UPI000907BEC4|nr:alkaline phosphatase [Flavihumibacter solisilvae]
MTLKTRICLAVISLFFQDLSWAQTANVKAQEYHGGHTGYTTGNAHSHNDYERPFAFWTSWNQGFGSIEADIFLEGEELLVAHDKAQLAGKRTLDSLYLRPLEQCIRKNNGKVYSGNDRRLQLMIDIKTAATPTLQKLVEKLNAYPAITSCKTVDIVISGNRPDAATFSSWPEWIRFDGDLKLEYSKEALQRINMLSGNFKNYSSWNGKGRLPEAEMRNLQQLVDKAHRLNKKIRFWNAPDMINSWYTYIDLGFDYINTDHVEELGTFFRQLPDRYVQKISQHDVYQPLHKNDGRTKKVKNVILLIGDGTGLPQWYAGYTANGGKLNVFNMRYTGLSKTSSFDNYITDSAPGATAFSSGEKTNNRAVGVDHSGNRLILLPEILQRKRIRSGVITSGDIRDATPASFYAHRSERSDYRGIANDLVQSHLSLLMGSGKLEIPTLDSIKSLNKNLKLETDEVAGRPAAERNGWAGNAFDSAVALLSTGNEGFFLVVEGAQIDHGGHANKLPYLVAEVLDFDKVIGKAMSFADTNGETLVIVTADHETGGLTLTAGDIGRAVVGGQFSTSDHTAIPVPVFAYGPGANLFTGVFENTAIFKFILQAFGFPSQK